MVRKIAAFLVFLMCLIVASATFLRWMPSVFFGDDLINYLDYLEGSFPSNVFEALIQAPLDKYRPVFHWLMAVLFDVFGAHLAGYLFVNLLLHSVNGVLVFLVVVQLTRNTVWLGVLAALVVVGSHFALYNVTQVTGLVEGLGSFFFLASLLAIVRVASLSGLRRDANVGYAVLLASLAVLSHERYVVLWAWIAFVLIFWPALYGRSRFGRGLGFVVAGLVPLYFLGRFLLFDRGALVGTGAQPLAFEGERAAEHLSQAILSLFGYNYGPEHLVGVPAPTLAPLGIFFAIGIFAAWLIGFFWAFSIASRRPIGERRELPVSLQWSLAFVLLAAVLLIPMMATVRLEQRWLVQPFDLLVMAFCSAVSVGLAYRRNAFICLAVLFFSLQLISGLIYSSKLDNVFFVYSARFAGELDGIVRRAGHPANVVIVGAVEHCEWPLQRGDFFKLRSGKPISLECFPDLASLSASPLPESTLVLRQTRLSGGLIDISGEWRQRRRLLNEVVVLDLLADFGRGRVNRDEKVDSPSGRGSMLASWDSSTGRARSVTVVSGFSHVYRDVQILAPALIRASVGMVYPTQSGANAVIRVHRADSPEQVVRIPLKPASKAGVVEQTPIEVCIDHPGTYTIELEALTDSGVDASGHWVAFSSPRVVAGERAMPR